MRFQESYEVHGDGGLAYGDDEEEGGLEDQDYLGPDDDEEQL